MSHLKFHDRKSIEAMLKAGETLGSIARCLGRATSTISQEIKSHRQESDYIGVGRIKNRCIFREKCSNYQLCLDRPDCVRKCSTCNKCNTICKDFQEQVCGKLASPPYVCNGCEFLRSCPLKKFLYDAKKSQEEYSKTLSEARSGFNLCEEDVIYIDSAVSPLIFNGQSIYHIAQSAENDLAISPRTLYRLVASGSISAKNIDMPRVCRMRPRKSAPDRLKVDRMCRKDRTFADFQAYMAKNPGVGVAQMDSVLGTRGGKLLLTVHIVQFDFMIAFIRERNTAASVAECFASLYNALSLKVYKSLFSVLLTDNGSEFSNPRALESPGMEEKQISRVFYCDPNAPFQKANVEVNHEFIRRIIPKGKSMDDLTQADVNLMMSHINSYRRQKFGGKSPSELFVNAFGIKVLRLLGQEMIEPRKIILCAKLLKK